MEVTSDVAIAGALVFYLLKYTTTAFKQTRSLLFKLILVAIESGSVSSLLAIIVLVTVEFLVFPGPRRCIKASLTDHYIHSI